MKRIARVGLVGGLFAFAVACSGSSTPHVFDSPDGGKSSPGGSSGGNNNNSNGGNNDGPGLSNADGGTINNNGCNFSDNTDHDGDGYSASDGDCNDCDPNANPGAFDVPGNGLDEDCNGTKDDDGAACDTGLKLDSTDAFDAAKAMGLCKRSDPNATGANKHWGVLLARWVKPDSTPLNDARGYGLLPSFGVNKPQEGGSMLAISSGAARAKGQAGYSSPDGLDKGYTSGTPAGYPKESPACPGIHTGEAHDGAGIEVQIRVPTNAKSFTFQENFFTFEFPDFICSPYNDFYVAMLTPKVASLPDANIAFDQQNNPISVNNSLLQVCTAQNAGGKDFPCPLGATPLSNTGFEGHAATGWLQTQAPVKPGDVITLLLTVWDSGDGILDSTVLIDKFTWSADPASGATTQPVPTPK